MSHRHNLPAQPRASRRVRWLSAAAALIAGAAGAAPTLLTVEECLETGTSAVSLPGAAGGTLSANPCTGCPILRLRFAANTLYLVGKQPVSYAKFRELAAKDEYRLDVFYDPRTQTLTRLRIPAVGVVK